ncbi:hypothetical protein CC86DRAFT_451470 [Ophiobolus disseminans]|uniref:BTB domain-containing protein n=1 Tax=Ophiobolus disseminans TaxID=1469910 RepID=A0A6A7ALA4_9PLEO|nr:hypothetical protein CC86DRAFT_451470 [Ophiobolus disseminans]
MDDATPVWYGLNFIVEIQTVEETWDEVQGVGSESREATFKVDRSLLTAYAPEFAKLLEHPGGRALKLDIVKAETIRIFILWLRSKFESASNKACPQALYWNEMEDCDEYDLHHFLSSDLEDCDHECEIGELSADLFVFAKTYNIPALRLDSLDRLVLCFNTYRSDYYPESWEDMMNMSPTTIQEAYERTSANSPLRRALVAGLCQFSDEVDFINEKLPSQFLVDMVRYLQQRVRESHKGGRPAFAIPSPCEFHEHEGAIEKKDSRGVPTCPDTRHDQGRLHYV